MDREMRVALCQMVDDLSVRQNKDLVRQVMRRARGHCEGVDDWDDECSVPADKCEFRIVREYGYSDAVEYGPPTAKLVTLLCDECYEQSEDGQRESYEQWVAERD
jgi:hypothetical protein